MPGVPPHGRCLRIFYGWESDGTPQTASQPQSEETLRETLTCSGRKQLGFEPSPPAYAPSSALGSCFGTFAGQGPHCLGHLSSQLLAKVQPKHTRGARAACGCTRKSPAFAVRQIQTRIPHPWKQFSCVRSQVSNTSQASVSIPRPHPHPKLL